MIEQFLNYLRLERNYSQRTVDSYGKDLRAFETHFKNLEGHLSWTTVDADVIRDWMEQMMDKGNSATSINLRLIDVALFPLSIICSIQSRITSASTVVQER